MRSVLADMFPLSLADTLDNGLHRLLLKQGAHHATLLMCAVTSAARSGTSHASAVRGPAAPTAAAGEAGGTTATETTVTAGRQHHHLDILHASSALSPLNAESWLVRFCFECCASHLCVCAIEVANLAWFVWLAAMAKELLGRCC